MRPSNRETSRIARWISFLALAALLAMAALPAGDHQSVANAETATGGAAWHG